MNVITACVIFKVQSFLLSAHVLSLETEKMIKIVTVIDLHIVLACSVTVVIAF
jgi:hypothetical protein